MDSNRSESDPERMDPDYTKSAEKTGPRRNAKWKQRSGPVKMEYIKDPNKRRNTRSERKRTLCVKAYELATLCGGRIFIQYKDELSKKWTYCSDDALWTEYREHGIMPASDQRLNHDGTVLVHLPSKRRRSFVAPSETSEGDLDFLVREKRRKTETATLASGTASTSTPVITESEVTSVTSTETNTTMTVPTTTMTTTTTTMTTTPTTMTTATTTVITATPTMTTATSTTATATATATEATAMVMTRDGVKYICI